jgi:hypothetical protein
MLEHRSDGSEAAFADRAKDLSRSLEKFFAANDVMEPLTAAFFNSRALPRW